MQTAQLAAATGCTPPEAPHSMQHAPQPHHCACRLNSATDTDGVGGAALVPAEPVWERRRRGGAPQRSGSAVPRSRFALISAVCLP